MASGDRTIAFTEEQLEDLSETIETVLGEKKTESGNWENIPYEILEQILLNVPSYQIPLNKSWICKRWTNVILQQRFWLAKLKRKGIIIENNIWSVLHELENHKIVTCLFYASVYQEYCMLKTPVPKFLKSIPLEKYDKYGGENYWCISDDSKKILMALGFLVCKSHFYILLTLRNKIVKGLHVILKLLTARNIPLSIHDRYSFLNFYPRIDYLQILKGPNEEAKNLLQFMGCLQTFDGLPLSIQDLYLSISVNEKNNCIDPGYSNLIKHVKFNGTIHLKAGSNFSKLPDFTSGLGTCFVTGLQGSQITWMTEVAKKFLNPGHLLGFFDYHLDFEETRRMLWSISKAGITMDHGVICQTSKLSEVEQEVIDDLFWSLWPETEGFEVCNPDGEFGDVFRRLFDPGVLIGFHAFED